MMKLKLLKESKISMMKERKKKFLNLKKTIPPLDSLDMGIMYTR